METVLMIQAVVKHYRVPFFTKLHQELLEAGIKLTVAYSDPNAQHNSRKDNADLPPEMGLKVKGHWIGDKLLYQSLWSALAKADLIIIGPESKYVNNPLLLILRALKLKKVAFWGLGPNRYTDRRPFSEWIKERVLTKVDWWFAYTATVASYLEQRGMMKSNITIVQNAVDSVEFRKLLSSIDENEIREAKRCLTGSPNSRIGLYCGMLAPIKDIPFLIGSARLARERDPEFHLVIIGNGPDRAWLEKEISGLSWIHYLGSIYGRESAVVYKMSDLFLLAGTAGLAIVDSFAAGLPVILTDLPTHPPEISYLTDTLDSRIVPHTEASFSQAIVETLAQPALMKSLRQGAVAAGNIYNMETMVGNFKAGIIGCLRASGVRAAKQPKQLIQS